MVKSKIIQKGDRSNQCGLALDVAKSIGEAWKGVTIWVHDTQGLGILKGKCSDKDWASLKEWVHKNAEDYDIVSENDTWLFGTGQIFDLLVEHHYNLYEALQKQDLLKEY